MGVAIPNQRNEARAASAPSPVTTYQLSPEELEKIRSATSKPPRDSEGKKLKQPMQASNYRPVADKVPAPVPAPVQEDKRRREGPSSGLTKKDLLVAIAAGETLSSIEKAWEMKYNTIHDWVKKWGVKGITQEAARTMLAEMGIKPVPVKHEPKATAKPVVESIQESPTPNVEDPVALEPVPEQQQEPPIETDAAGKIIDAVVELKKQIEHWQAKAVALARKVADEKQALLNQINQVAVERDALQVELSATKKAALDVLEQVRQAASSFQVTQ